MQLHLIFPEKPLYTGDIDMATIPGAEGEFGVLPGPAPFVSTLKAGIITINPESLTPTSFAVLDRVAETAESLEGMTADNVRAQLEAARQAVETATSDAKRHAAEKQLLMAETIAAIM